MTQCVNKYVAVVETSGKGQTLLHHPSRASEGMTRFAIIRDKSWQRIRSVCRVGPVR